MVSRYQQQRIMLVLLCVCIDSLNKTVFIGMSSDILVISDAAEASCRKIEAEKRSCVLYHLSKYTNQLSYF